MCTSSKHLSILLLAMVFLVPSRVLAQAETTGRISGRVVDEQGSPLAGARVTLVSSALQGERTVQTDARGEFLAALLPIGPYAVSVVSPNMQTTQVSLWLRVGQTVPLEIVMEPGEDVRETVTVYGAATPLETTVAGENFNYWTEVEELPIALRNINNVTLYAPNVQEGVRADSVAVGVETGFVIAGAPAYDSVVQLDGAEISNWQGLALDLYIEDAIEEVQVMTSGISARYGRFQGGVINAITRTGGNEFSGAIRANFSNQSWNSTTPFGEEQADELNQSYQATLGGYVLKDRFWFFAGAMTVPTDTTNSTTSLTQESFQREITEDRWQLKLRGAPWPDHVIEGSYLDRKRTDSGPPAFGQIPGHLESANSINDASFSLLNFTYQGVLSPRSFLDVRASRREGSTVLGGELDGGSPFTDLLNWTAYNNAWFDRSDEWVEDSEGASLAYTRVFRPKRHGSHTFEAGFQYANRFEAGAGRTSASGYSLGVNLGNTPFAVWNEATGKVTYNLPADTYIRRNQPLEIRPWHNVDNYALYAQDSWQIGRWRVDAGLRWETYEVSSSRPDLDPGPSALAPRLGLTRTISPKLQFQATWGRYVTRLDEVLLGYLDWVLSGSGVDRLYTGPGRFGLTSDEVEAVLANDSQWGIVEKVWDPGQPTEFLAEGFELPYADELTVGVRGAMPGNSGSFTVTFIDRDYENLIEDFRGDFGYRELADPFTGDPLIDPDTNEPQRFDLAIRDNASTATRRYRALASTWEYRPGARWSLGGNWTYSESTGNYEHHPNGVYLFDSPIGNYERSRPEEAAAPDGYLGQDVRNRIQVWGDYRWDLNRAGVLVLGGVARYQSGSNWSRTAQVEFAEDPLGIYNLPPKASYEHFFDGRGNNRFDDWSALDLSARWQFPIFKQLDGWLKFTVANVFDNDALITYDTTGIAVEDGDGNLEWQPLGNCGPGDAPSTECTNFGAIRSQSYYQPPRSYLFTLGLAW